MMNQYTFHLLLVEDNPNDAEIAIHQLRHISAWRFQVVHVPQLQQALDMLEHEQFDAIVLDLDLPDSKGIGTLRRLRSQYDSIPCIIFSGSSSEELIDQVLHEGAQDFIVKADIPVIRMAQSILFAIEQHRIQRERKQLQKILAADPNAIIVVDMNGMVCFVNDAALELFGRRREEFISELLDFSVREGMVAEIQVLRGNEQRTAEVRVVYIDWDGQPACMAVLRDITEPKKLAERLRLTQKMEAIGQLAGGIAHDFNNILTVINGHIELARAELPHQHSVQADLHEIELAANRATEIVRQILTFSRKREIKHTAVDIQPIVKEAGQFLRATLPANIEIQLHCEPQLPAALADETKIYQILMNLGTNAAHAMRQNGGRLEIGLYPVVLNKEQSRALPELRPGHYICLSVGDTGHGMSTETMQQIFDPFFTTKGPGEGTGLGLSVVHGIVKEHNGATMVSSEPDRGTLFEIYLPAAKVPPPQPQASAPIMRYGHYERILYVDDEHSLVRLATQLLRQRHYEVAGFHEPLRALQEFQNDPQRFAAAVVDRSMPQIDGPELARRLLAIRPDLPIVMVTGYAHTDDLEMIRQIGIRDLLLKPGALRDLPDLLYSILADMHDI